MSSRPSTKRKSTSTSRKQRNRAQDIRRAQARRYPVLPVIIGGIVVLGIVAIVAVALSGGKKGNGASSANGVAQVRPVRVEGNPLPAFDSSASGDPAIGDPAPTLIGQNFAGKAVTIRNDGRPKAILFVAHWCPHCQAEIPRIANYLKNTGLPKNVELYIVPTSTSPNYPNYPPSAWLQREGVGNVPTLVDDQKGTAFTAYGGSSFPYFVLIGNDGKVVARFSGEVEEAALPGIFDALSKGAAIPGAQAGGSSPTPST